MTHVIADGSVRALSFSNRIWDCGLAQFEGRSKRWRWDSSTLIGSTSTTVISSQTSTANAKIESSTLDIQQPGVWWNYLRPRLSCAGSKAPW